MKPRKARVLIMFLSIIGFIFVLLSYIHIVFLPIGILVIASTIVPNLLFCRCPHCGEHLGRSWRDYCTHCGAYIDD